MSTPRTAAALVSQRAWWSFDRPRWVTSAAAAGALTVGGAADFAAGSGLAGELVAEAAFGGALVFAVAAAVTLRRAWRGRSDDHVEAYAPGTTTVLIGIGAGASSPALARITRNASDSAVATLHQHATPGGEEVTVRARVGEQLLTLQHRLGTEGDIDDADPPEQVLRLVDHDNRPLAGAHVHRDGDLEDWTLPVDGHVLRFRGNRRRRPRRRTLIDTTTGAAYLLGVEVRPRHRVITLTGPPTLSVPSVVLLLWLAHLLDVHAQLSDPEWDSTDEDWMVVPDDFPGFLGPGGFGDPQPRPIPSSGPGFGGSS